MKFIFFSLFLSFFTTLSLTATTPLLSPLGPDVKFVITPTRILLVTDETPIVALHVEVKNAAGKVVLEKQFSSKTTDWTLCIAELPTGAYTVVSGGKETCFKH